MITPLRVTVGIIIRFLQKKKVSQLSCLRVDCSNVLENQDEDLKILAVSQAESLLSLPAVITTNPGLPASSILEWQATVTAAEVCAISN